MQDEGPEDGGAGAGEDSFFPGERCVSFGGAVQTTEPFVGLFCADGILMHTFSNVTAGDTCSSTQPGLNTLF